MFLLGTSGNEIRAIDVSRSLSAAAGVHARAGTVCSQRGRECVTALNRQSAAGAPTAQNSGGHATLEWRRYLIDGVELPVLSQVKFGRATVESVLAWVHAAEAGDLVIGSGLSPGFIN